MFKLLLALFTIFNISAIIILLLSYVSTLLNNINISRLASAKICLPEFFSCRPSFIKCCVVSSLFIFLDWLVFSGSYVSESGMAGNIILAKFTATFAGIWAGLFVLAIIFEIGMKFIKDQKYDLRDVFLPLTVRTVWYILLTFIIV